MIPVIVMSATTLKPLTGEVNNIEDFVKIQQSAEIHDPEINTDATLQESLNAVANLTPLHHHNRSPTYSRGLYPTRHWAPAPGTQQRTPQAPKQIRH